MSEVVLERFRRWVAEQESAGKNRTQVAAAIGCSESGLSRVLGGSRGVGGALAAKIERATSRSIRAIDWYEAEAEGGTDEGEAASTTDEAAA